MFTRIRVGNPKLAKQDGQAVVEFALVLPLLLIVILGVVDFGLAFNYKNDETHLANEAIRFAVVNKCQPCEDAGMTLEEFVRNDADSEDLRNGGGQIVAQTNPWTGHSPEGALVSFCLPDAASGATGARGEALRATVSAKYRFLPALVGFVGLPDEITIKSTATQRIEQGHDATSRYTIVPCS